MRITANQITLGRIVVLPVPCAFLLSDSLALKYVALVIFTIIGVLDVYDGVLARRQGPTQFGAMLDPLADKLFIACVIVPFGAKGLAPLWLQAALLAREFVVTGLRTQTALRKQTIKTSQLAKLKTSVQMVGFGMVFLNVSLPPAIAPYTLGLIAAGSVVVFVVMAIRRRRFPSIFVWVPAALLLIAFGSYLAFPKQDATLLYLYVILAFTWGSGLDYLLGAARIILRHGIRAVDVTRLLWTAAAVVVCTVIVVNKTFAFLVVIALAGEFAIGGVDNLRALSGKESSNLAFAVRSLLLGALAIGIHVALSAGATPSLLWALCIAMAAIPVGWAIWDAVQARSLFSSKHASAAYSTAPPPRTSAG